MKRMHIHLSVEDLEQNIQFYSTLFAAKPSVQHDDYAKWMLDDPRINFAISDRGVKAGIDHLGMQTENDQELHDLKTRLDLTQKPIETQDEAACCYMRSDKHWVTDPQGIAWESFHSLSEIPTFNESIPSDTGEKMACCTSAVVEDSSSCCSK